MADYNLREARQRQDEQKRKRAEIYPGGRPLDPPLDYIQGDVDEATVRSMETASRDIEENKRVAEEAKRDMEQVEANLARNAADDANQWEAIRTGQITDRNQWTLIVDNQRRTAQNAHEVALLARNTKSMLMALHRTCIGLSQQNAYLIQVVRKLDRQVLELEQSGGTPMKASVNKYGMRSYI